MKLTAKQERYAMALASGTMSQSAAYRSAGYGGKSAPATIHAHASALAADGRVVARVQALRADMVAVATYDSQALMADLQRTAKNAADSGQYSASVRALELLGKMIGAFPQVREMLIRHSGRGAVQHESAPTTMTADRARGILGASKERAPVP
jgi:phage terminase small subunit